MFLYHSCVYVSDGHCSVQGALRHRDCFESSRSKLCVSNATVKTHYENSAYFICLSSAVFRPHQVQTVAIDDPAVWSFVSLRLCVIPVAHSSDVSTSCF